MKEYRDEILSVKSMLKTQGSNGNWDYDPYMHGMYNGMELVLATIEGRSPEFRSPPPSWRCDFPDNSPPTCEGGGTKGGDQ